MGSDECVPHFVMSESVPNVRWGKATADWTQASGSSITVIPVVSRTDNTVTGEPNVTAYVTFNDSPPIFTNIDTNDILPYVPIDGDVNRGVLLPVGTTYSSSGSLGSSNETEAADTTTLSACEFKTVTLTRLYRMAYGAGFILYGYYRDEVYKHGVLTSVSGETRVTIADTEAC
jgi:hypothetical protein